MPGSKLIIGCGYVGERVARWWVQHGDTVFALTRSDRNAESLQSLGVQPLRGDVTLPETLPVLPEVDTVLYAVGLDRSSGRTQREVYVVGLENVLQRLMCSGRNPFERFLYISSTSVYGQDAGEWVDESSACEPQASNGRICLEAEQLLRQHVPDALILRLAGIYGPGRLVARVEALRAGTPLEGNPRAWLNLIHVDDAVAAILACDRRGTNGETYLICDDQPQQRQNYYKTLAFLMGAPAPVVDTSSTAPSQPTGLNKRCRNRRIREELGLTLSYPTFAAGLQSALVGESSDRERTSK